MDGPDRLSGYSYALGGDGRASARSYFGRWNSTTDYDDRVAEVLTQLPTLGWLRFDDGAIDV